MADLDKELKNRWGVVKCDIKHLREDMANDLLIELYGTLDTPPEEMEKKGFDEKKKLSDKYDLLCRLLKETGRNP